MKRLKLIARASLLLLCLPLSACLFDVGSHYGNDYQIQGDGSVDLTLAPFEDIDGLQLKGFNLFAGGAYSAALECEAGGGFVPVYTNQDVTKKMFQFDAAGVPDFSSLVGGNCDLDPDGDDYVIQLALRLGDKYLPVFTQGNLMCVVTQLQFQIMLGQADFYGALAQCVAQDGRATSDPIGFNAGIEEINILSLRVSQGYVDTLAI